MTYPSKIPGYIRSSKDMLKLVFNTAESKKIKMRVGFGFNDKWQNRILLILDERQVMVWI